MLLPELDPNTAAKGKATNQKTDNRGRSKGRNYDIQSV